MSHRNRAAKATVSSWIRDLRASDAKAPHGLPEDVLVRALDGYGGTELNCLKLETKRRSFAITAGNHALTLHALVTK